MIKRFADTSSRLALAGLLAAVLCCPARGAVESEPPPQKEAPPNKAARDLLDCWQNKLDRNILIRFEPTRCIFFQNGQQEVVGAAYEPGLITLNNQGRKVSVPFEFRATTLLLTLKEKPEMFFRLDKVPPELELKPLPLGTVANVPAARVKSIQAELAKRQVEDQAVRTDRSRYAEMAKVDAGNTAWLIAQVRELGWIDVVRFGREAADAAFLIVQHSMNLPLMMAALPEIEKDVRAKRLDAQNYALLFDRLQLRIGLKQRYGSQIGVDERGQPAVLPLESAAKVEEHRKELGLMPLSEYLEIMKQQTGQAVKMPVDP